MLICNGLETKTKSLATQPYPSPGPVGAGLLEFRSPVANHFGEIKTQHFSIWNQSSQQKTRMQFVYSNGRFLVGPRPPKPVVTIYELHVAT